MLQGISLNLKGLYGASAERKVTRRHRLSSGSTVLPGLGNPRLHRVQVLQFRMFVGQFLLVPKCS